MPILVDVDVPTVIEKLLEEVQISELVLHNAKRNKKYALAARAEGQSRAYQYAARLLGWRQWEEGDAPARKID